MAKSKLNKKQKGNPVKKSIDKKSGKKVIKNSILEKIRSLPQKVKIWITVTFIVIFSIFMLILNLFLRGEFAIANRIFSWQDGLITATKTENQNQSANQIAANKALTKLESLIDEEPEELLITKTNLNELDIYPESWIQKHFSSAEQKNALISGPDRDPDNDGLSNKQEYFFSSDPKNAYTLCGEKRTDKENCDRNDKENFDKNISPLTGLEFSPIGEFEITYVDKAVSEDLENSLTSASAEGLDFPEIYQLSQSIDLTAELEEVKINQISDSRNSILIYLQNRVDVLGDFAQEDALTNFSEIYQLTSVEGVRELRNKYQALSQDFSEVAVPEIYAGAHRANLFTLNKITESLTYRMERIQDETIGNPGVNETLKEQSKEIMWGFRQMIEEDLKLDKNLEDLESS